MTRSPPTAPDEQFHATHARLSVLDGWRAISILLVLATHMLPLGPKSLQLNSTSGPAGMSLFFTLSGFLITTTLLRHPGVVSFFIRRLFRIVPLAVVGSSVILLIQSAPLSAFPPYWFYYCNYIPESGFKAVSHFWSLCVEMHFYVFIGLLAAVAGRRGLLLLPLVCLGVTAWRVRAGATINVNTHLRVDEILAGCVLALCYARALGKPGDVIAAALRAAPVPLLALLFLGSCHPASGSMQYVRPYLGAALVGATLLRSGWYTPLLASRPLRYVAEISYALYVVHPASMLGWLGEGDTITRYLKRPLCFAISFGLAHLSTFWFERRFTALGKRLAHRLEQRQGQPRPGPEAANS